MHKCITRLPLRFYVNRPNRLTGTLAATMSTTTTDKLHFKINHISKPYQVPLNTTDTLHNTQQSIIYNNTDTLPYLITQHPTTKYTDHNNKSQRKHTKKTHPYSTKLSIKPLLIAAQHYNILPESTQPTFFCNKKLLKELSILQYTGTLFYYDIYVQYYRSHIYMIPSTAQWELNSAQLGRFVETMYVQQHTTEYSTYECIHATLGQHNILYSSTCDAILKDDIPGNNLKSGQSIEIKANNAFQLKDQWQQYYSNKQYIYYVPCSFEKGRWKVQNTGQWLSVPQPDHIDAKLQQLNTILTYIRNNTINDNNMHVYSVAIDKDNRVLIRRKALLDTDEIDQIYADKNHKNDIESITSQLSNTAI